MHLVIISGSSRIRSLSNTTKIISAFSEGFVEGTFLNTDDFSINSVETYYLSDRKQWKDAECAFFENENVLFALPLFVDNVPGNMLEFLELLLEKNVEKNNGKLKKISFLLQGGFDEGCQYRCCQKFLEALPAKFGAECSGVLVKGGNFMIRFFPSCMAEKLVNPYKRMGQKFAEYGSFNFEEAKSFCGEEQYSSMSIFAFKLFGSFFLRKVFTRILHKVSGDKKKTLMDRPY